MSTPTPLVQVEFIRGAAATPALLGYARLGLCSLSDDAIDGVQWTTLTGVRGYETWVGRQQDLARTETGWARVELENENGRYSPEAVPLGGLSALGISLANANVAPRRRIRIFDVQDGAYYPRFYGYIRRWRAGIETGDQHVIIEATDPTLKLARYKLAHTTTQQASGARFSDLLDRIGHPKARVAAQFTRANSESLSIGDNTDLSTGNIDFTLAAWVYLDSKPGAGAFMAIAGKYVSPNREYRLIWDSVDDRFKFQVSDTGANAVTVIASTFGAPALGTWYLVKGWHDSVANTINIQINDGAVDSGAHSAGVYDGTAGFEIGAANTSSTWDGRLMCVGFWKSVLSSTLRTTLYNYGSPLSRAQLPATLTAAASLVSYWNLDEASGTRRDTYGSNHLTDNNTVTTNPGKGTFRDLDTGALTVSSRALSNLQALEHWEQVAAIEAGHWYFAGDGCATFHQRNARDSDSFSTAIQYTFGGSSGLPYRDPDYEYGDEQIENVQRITRTGGTEQVASDPTSIAEYQESMYALDSPDFVNDANALTYASHRLSLRRLPIPHLRSITLEGGGHDALWTAMLNVKPSDRVRVIHTFPGNTGLDREFFVEGVSHSMSDGGGRHVAQLLLSRADSSLGDSSDAVIGFSRIGIGELG